MQTADVLIVGGGPAGLSVASALSNKLTSIVVHQDAEIGRPVRTSGGSFVADLNTLEIPNSLYQIIDELAFYSDRETATFSINDDQMAVLDITGLYQYLAGLSANKPCTILTDAKFLETTALPDDSYISCIRTRDAGTIKVASKYIVDASGWHCAVTSGLGLVKPPQRLGVGTEYEFAIGDYPANKAILFVGSPVLSGYGWVFPTGYGTLRLGVGVIKPETAENPRDIMDALLQSGFLDKLGVTVPDDYEVNSGIVPSVAFEKQTVFGNVIRVGDAANCATPVAGEGIRIAIEQGRALGQALSAQNVPLALQSYQRSYAKKYARDYKIGFWANQRITNYSPSEWDKSMRRLARLSELEMTSLLRSNFKFTSMVRTVVLQLKRKLFS